MNWVTEPWQCFMLRFILDIVFLNTAQIIILVVLRSMSILLEVHIRATFISLQPNIHFKVSIDSSCFSIFFLFLGCSSYPF